MTTTEHSTDHQLKAAIEREQDWAGDVDNDRVGVAVADGTVMLSGEVLSYPEKAAAVSAALRVRGVTAAAAACRSTLRVASSTSTTTVVAPKR